MRTSYSSLVLSTVLLAAPCLADDDADIPLAAWEIPADATRPDNVSKQLQLITPKLDLAKDAGEMTPPRLGLDIGSKSDEEAKEPRQKVPFFDGPTISPTVAPLATVASEMEENEPRRRTSWKDDTDRFNQETAATVNGERILNGEVLDRYAIYLSGLRDDLQRRGRTQAEYNRQRETFIRRELPAHIQYRLYAAAITSQLSPQQLLELHTQLNSEFIKHEEPKLLEQLEVKTHDELELKIEAAGGSMTFTRKNFLTTACSREFFARELARDDAVSPDEMKAYYESHLDDFAQPATIDWEQIQVSYFDENAKSVCLARLKEAQAELQQPGPTAEIVAKYSDGPSANKGGFWRSMPLGTLTDSNLEKLLLESPLDRWSEIYEGPSEFQLVRVLKRTSAGAAPYVEVEDKILRILNTARVRKLSQQMLTQAEIESDYDLSSLHDTE